MKKLFCILLMLLLPTVALAAPFLVCDPYTVDGSEPTSFVVIINGTTYTVPATAIGTTQVYLHMDIAGKYVTGTNTVTAKGKNMWGDGPITPSPLVFKAGVPAAPGGLRYSVD
jgi:hypothetical protein